MVVVLVVLFCFDYLVLNLWFCSDGDTLSPKHSPIFFIGS